MPKIQLQTVLSDFGLADKESAMFLALVKLGPVPASRIAKEAGLTRTLVYDLAENLKRRGLISESDEAGGTRRFQAVGHAGLVAAIARKRRELGSLENQAEQVASQFAALEQGRRQKTRVRFFSGVEGVESVYEESISAIRRQPPGGPPALSIYSPENLEKLIPGWSGRSEYFDVPHAAVRHILAESEFIEPYLKQIRSFPSHQFRVWKREWGQFPADTICWQDRLAHIDLTGHPSGVIIENAAVAETFRMWFERIWQGL